MFLDISIFTMSTSPPGSPGGDPTALGPQSHETTQSAATQDLDRMLQEVADEFATQQQALRAAMEERRRELLVANGQDPNMISPERLLAGGSSSTGRDGTWEQVPDPNAPPVGSSSSGSGAPQTSQPSTGQMPPPQPNTSGLFRGNVPQSPHSWERRRMEQQEEEAALNAAAREQDVQTIIQSHVDAAVAEALRQQAANASPARQSSDGSFGRDAADPNSYVRQELKRLQAKLKEEQAARAKLLDTVTAAGFGDRGAMGRDDEIYITPMFQQANAGTPREEERLRKLLSTPGIFMLPVLNMVAMRAFDLLLSQNVADVIP